MAGQSGHTLTRYPSHRMVEVSLTPARLPDAGVLPRPVVRHAAPRRAPLHDPRRALPRLPATPKAYARASRARRTKPSSTWSPRADARDRTHLVGQVLPLATGSFMASQISRQRRPKNPSTNRMMTTAPTSQMIWFTMEVLCWRRLVQARLPGAHRHGPARTNLGLVGQLLCALANGRGQFAVTPESTTPSRRGSASASRCLLTRRATRPPA